MTNEEKINMLVEALDPFAKMDRDGGDLKEIACMRGICEDMTIIYSKDFRNASEVLKKIKQEK